MAPMDVAIQSADVPQVGRQEVDEHAPHTSSVPAEPAYEARTSRCQPRPLENSTPENANVNSCLTISARKLKQTSSGSSPKRSSRDDSANLVVGRTGERLSSSECASGRRHVESVHRQARSRLSKIDLGAPPSLFLLSLESVAINIKHVESLEGIPEDIVMMLFWGTLQLGGMTEAVLGLFLGSRHPQVGLAVQRLGMKAAAVQPVLPTRCGDSFR